MPYVEGESLRDRLEREHQLPVEEAVRIAREVADALDYAHRQGVIHRDIKPENILLHDGHAIVADFGIALAFSTEGAQRLTEAGMRVGTQLYMSPEQALGEADVDGRTDQYSLACVVYEMLTGEPLFVAMTARGMIAKQLRDPVPRLSTLRDVPTSLDQAVTRALAKARVDRFRTIGEFSAALAEPDSNAPRRTPAAWRGANAVIAVAVGLALLGIFIAFRISGSDSGQFDQELVLVAPFENRTGDPRLDPLGMMAAEWLTQRLSATDFLHVVDVQTLLASTGGGPTAPDQRLRNLARENRAGTVVTGSYYLADDSIRIQARVIDGQTGEVRKAVDPIVGPASSVTALLTPLTQRITGALALVFDARLNVSGIPTVQPPTYEAYREFLAGMESYGTTDVSLNHFLRAAQLDPDFAQARLWAAIELSDESRYPSADSLFQALLRTRDHLAPYDQANLDYFYSGFVKGDWQASYHGAQEMLRLAPNGAHAHYAVGVTALAVNRPNEAAMALRQIDPHHGWGRTWPSARYWHAEALHQLGDFAGELSVARELRAEVPDHPGTRLPEIRALAALGRVGEAVSAIQESLALRGDAGEAALLRLDAGLELRAHGATEVGDSVLNDAEAVYRGLPTETQQRADVLEDHLLTLYALKQWDEVLRVMRSLGAKHSQSTVYLGLAGGAAAHQGDQEEARRTDEQLRQWSKPYSFGAPALWRARIAAALGRPDLAVDNLSAALAQGGGPGGIVGLHVDPDFALLRSYPPFLALIRPKG